MARTELLRELWDFMKVRKKFWLGPIIVILVLFGLLLLLTENFVMTPFIYTLF